MRWLLFVAFVGVLVASGCSPSNPLPCCQAGFDASAGAFTVCVCGGAGGSYYNNNTSTGCTVTQLQNGQSTTVTGTPVSIAACSSSDGG